MRTCSLAASSPITIQADTASGGAIVPTLGGGFVREAGHTSCKGFSCFLPEAASLLLFHENTDRVSAEQPGPVPSSPLDIIHRPGFVGFNDEESTIMFSDGRPVHVALLFESKKEEVLGELMGFGHRLAEKGLIHRDRWNYPDFIVSVGRIASIAYRMASRESLKQQNRMREGVLGRRF